MPTTPRPPHPQRYARVEELVREGYPDREICRIVRAEFSCSDGTVRTDLHRLWAELSKDDMAAKSHRRDVMRYQLQSLQVETREVAKLAREGYVGGFDKDGKPQTIQDMRTAGLALATAEKVYGRLGQLDGVSESDKVKAEILKQKLLGGLSGAELEAALREEVEKLVTSMTDDEWRELQGKRGAWKRAGRPSGKPRHPSKAVGGG